MAKKTKKPASKAVRATGKKSAPKAKKKAPSKPKKPVKTKAKPVSKPAKKVKPVKKPVKPVRKAVAPKAKPAPKPAPKPVAAPVKSSSKKGRSSANRAQTQRPEQVKPSPTSPSLQLTIQPVVNQRPIAHKPAAPSVQDENKTRYSPEELHEFETLINGKLTKARDEFRLLKETLNRNNDEGTDSTSGGNTKVLEDGAETAEKENLSQQAARQQKYIQNLENALIRIKNGTYGICSVTGKLIPRERLIAVPHTTQSIEAKMMQKD